MTKQQALEKLKETKELSTNMLNPLNISFESFLKYAQIGSEKKQKETIEKLIKALEYKNE